MIHFNTKKVFKYAMISVLICLFLALCGCKSKKVITDDTKYVHDTTYVERRVVDTTIVHEPDTAMARLLAECDENNQVLIHELNARDGERTNIDPVIKYVYVEDPVTGEKLRKAEIDIIATTQKLQDNIKILEERLTSAHTENEKLHQDLEKESDSWINWMLAGFALGIALCFIVFLFVNKFL